MQRCPLLSGPQGSAMFEVCSLVLLWSVCICRLHRQLWMGRATAENCSLEFLLPYGSHPVLLPRNICKWPTCFLSSKSSHPSSLPNANLLTHILPLPTLSYLCGDKADPDFGFCVSGWWFRFAELFWKECRDYTSKEVPRMTFCHEMNMLNPAVVLCGEGPPCTQADSGKPLRDEVKWRMSTDYKRCQL